MKLLADDLKRSLSQFASIANREKKGVVRMAARGFVKDIVAVTPPGSQGVTGTAAKKQGEAAIRRDLNHILVPKPRAEIEHILDIFGRSHEQRVQRTKTGAAYLVDRDVICTNYDEIAAFHKSKRTKNGRVSTAGKRTRDIGRWKSWDRRIIPEDLFEKYLKSVLARVGFLASGWNAMAERLDVRVPSWVKRHGTKAGVVKVIETGTLFRIEGINETSYVGNVKDYLRRIDKVVGYQAAKLDRQCLAILKKSARRCGFR